MADRRTKRLFGLLEQAFTCCPLPLGERVRVEAPLQRRLAALRLHGDAFLTAGRRVLVTFDSHTDLERVLEELEAGRVRNAGR